MPDNWTDAKEMALDESIYTLICRIIALKKAYRDAKNDIRSIEKALDNSSQENAHPDIALIMVNMLAEGAISSDEERYASLNRNVENVEKALKEVEEIRAIAATHISLLKDLITTAESKLNETLPQWEESFPDGISFDWEMGLYMPIYGWASGNVRM